MTFNTALVVDDSKVARLTLNKLLRARGLEIIEHTSAESALAWLTEESNKPDIIFMDVMMEGMDGLDATGIIKSDPAINHLPVIICSGSDGGVARERALSAGANGMLSKPPVEAELDELLASLIPSSFQEKSATMSGEVADNKQLVAEQSIQKIREQLSTELDNKLTSELQARLPSLIEVQMNEFRQQVGVEFDHAMQDKLHELQQSISEQVSTWVSQAAKPILQKAVADVDLSSAALNSLQNVAPQWLTEQSAEIRESLLKQLEQDLMPMVNNAAKSELSSMVTEEVENHLNGLQQQTNEQIQAALTKALSGLNTTRIIAFVAIAVSLVAIGLRFV